MALLVFVLPDDSRNPDEQRVKNADRKLNSMKRYCIFDGESRNTKDLFRSVLDVASEPIISDFDDAMESSILISLLPILAATFYLLVHFGLAAGLKKTKNLKSKEQPFVSIIVAARNEENNLSRLIQCLLQQTYPHYEIIIVNDRSTDRTAELIAGFKKNNLNITSINITNSPDDMPPKKNALRAGITLSKGDILCFTDADCFPPPTWIKELIQSFGPQVGMVAGFSPYKILQNQSITTGFFKTLFFQFIEYEEFRAAIWSAGSIGWNLGWLCTGRNLAYRRKVYEEVGGFEKIKMSVSGDDDLFMQLVRRQTAWKIRYVQTRESFVPTLPPVGFWPFVEQRKRHFSAAKFFTFPMKLFFFLYHLSNFLIFLSPLFFLTNTLSLSVFIVCISVKMFSDFILFASAFHIFDGYFYRRSFIFMEAIYVLYNSLMGPLGLLRKFEWKQSQTQ
jgi:cellulose synthase/poly-beta-1,6-N-acetylglucosamine synthase-like glycosyltransferase